MTPFTTIRKKQRYIALFFLTAVAVPEAKAFVNNSGVAVMPPLAAGAPVAASASEYVDPFTGDFNYSVPLMSVPGPNGENVPITASYHAGIRMNQSASWLGLGWDYNPGEISRQVNGAPDDNNGKVSFSASFDPPSTTVFQTDNAIYGPMYYNASGTPNYVIPASWTSHGSYSLHNNRYMAHDMYSNSSKIRFNVGSTGYDQTVTLPFAAADYDNYSISGSGLRGSLQPYTKSRVIFKNEKTPSQGLSTTGDSIKQMQFYFSRSADMSVTAIESSANRLKTGYFVRYLTNVQLNNTTTCDTVGFIDYRAISGTRRDTNDFVADGIGAYQVTTPGGMTYHYSLPVYTDDEQYISFGLSSSAFDVFKRTDIYRKRYKYATSWKLTAITGPDYVDNGNHIVDANDKGYWIAYDYSLWCNDYKWSSSPYGFKKDLQLRSVTNTFPSPIYGPRGSVTSGSSQQYYLDRVRTATHTAWFVKSIRKDEQSMDHLYNSSNSPKPELKLDRIILLRTEDSALFGSGTITAVSGFTTSGCNPNGNVIHDGIYAANAASIDNASLKSVEFETDYSLCKKYYTNIANTVTASNITFSYASYNPVLDTIFADCSLFGTKIGRNKPSAISTSTSDSNNTGGKLTLNKIKVYEDGKQSVYPSYEFTYNSSNNPDYDMDKVDIWGYYKSDYDNTANHRSYYTTNVSKDYLDAWSLKDITTPLGGEIHVNYEADRYIYEEGYDSDHLPYFVYLIDSRSVTEDPAVMYVNESDYIYSYVERKRVIPNFASCSGPFYEVKKNTDPTQFFPSDYALIHCPGSITDAYSPANGDTEYGWTKNSVALAYGGGIRVKDIIIENPESAQSYKIEYTYENGLCTYKPDRFEIEEYSLTVNRKINERDNGPSMIGYGKVTTKTINSLGQDNGKVEYQYNIDYRPSFISGSMVGTPTTNRTGNVYFRDSCAFSGSSADNCKVNAWKYQYTLKMQKQIGSFNGFGQLLKNAVYDRSGALISYSSNYYKNIAEVDESFQKEKQFITHLNHRTAPRVCAIYTSTVLPNGSNITLCNSNFPIVGMQLTDTTKYSVSSNIIKRQYTVLDKTESFSNGITTTTIVNERDPISMQPLSSTVIDPTQGAITTTVKPAYTNTVSYSSMGLKSACPTCATNENMVSLVEEQRIIKQPVFRNTDGVITYNSSGPGILMGASKQTYANTVYHRKYNTSTSKYESVSEAANTWLPYENYTALTNASTPSTTTSPTWKKTNTVTLFSTSNKALESEGMSGRKSAVKFGYKNLYPLASISDANYNCFGFTGFEDTLNVGTFSSPVWHFGGEFNNATMRQAGNAWIKPHTGNYVAAVPATSTGPGILLNGYEHGRVYRASVWVHKNSPATAKLVMALDGSVSGTPYYDWKEVFKNDANNITVGDWTLMSVQLSVPETFTESGGHSNNGLFIAVWNDGSTTAWYDDLMVRPVDAPITGTVYDPKTARVIATLDNENFASWFEYDAAGRVTATYVETRLGVKKTSETQYNFSRNN
jgi:YD repeat-containing protein